MRATSGRKWSREGHVAREPLTVNQVAEKLEGRNRGKCLREKVEQFFRSPLSRDRRRQAHSSSFESGTLTLDGGGGEGDGGVEEKEGKRW